MKPNETASAPEDPGALEKRQRDAGGLFGKGNTIGPGRPAGPRWTERLRKKLTEAEIDAILDDNIKTAKTHGDWRARADSRNFLFKYATPTIHALMLDNERGLEERPMAERVVMLLHSLVMAAEELGTPEAAKDALQAM
jgi:hypothetical protein